MVGEEMERVRESKKNVRALRKSSAPAKIDVDVLNGFCLWRDNIIQVLE